LMLHRDLKSSNILMGRNFQCKLADFGLTIVKSDSNTKTNTNQLAGTLPWMAPEIFSFRPKFSTKSDIYAFGIILWEVGTRLYPYEGANPEVIEVLVRKGEREVFEETNDGRPGGFSELAQRCWHQEPSKRPTIEEILAELGNIRGNFEKVQPT